MDNILRLSIILLSVHLSFIPLWALSRVAFQLLTEWRDSSERWGRECGGCSGLWMKFILPWEDFKRERINQPGGAPAAELCPPAVSPEVSDAPSMPSHTADWMTHWPGVSQLDCSHTHTPPLLWDAGTKHWLESAMDGSMSTLLQGTYTQNSPSLQVGLPVFVFPNPTNGCGYMKIHCTFLLLTTSAHSSYKVWVMLKANYRYAK